MEGNVGYKLFAYRQYQFYKKQNELLTSSCLFKILTHLSAFPIKSSPLAHNSKTLSMASSDNQSNQPTTGSNQPVKSLLLDPLKRTAGSVIQDFARKGKIDPKRRLGQFGLKHGSDKGKQRAKPSAEPAPTGATSSQSARRQTLPRPKSPPPGEPSSSKPKSQTW